MSDIRTGREELLKVADELKKNNRPAAKRIVSIVDTYLMRAHVGKRQGPQKVKRAATKPAAKKTPAKKKAPVKKKSPAKKTAPTSLGGHAPKMQTGT